jgi:oligopeptide/dipeptide ABC transporter ATP-binding protein
MTAALIELERVRKHFPIRRGLLRRRGGAVHAVDDVSLAIPPATTLSLVGESGCGKSTTIKLILGIERPTAGRILFEGGDISGFDRAQRQRYRAAVQAVFQDPWGSLDPRMRVGAIVAEPLRATGGCGRSETRARVAAILDQVGLAPEHAARFPHEFSGGQRQRIAVARSLVLNPRLVVLDEPVSALDVSIRAQIINLLKDLQERHGLAYLLVAHHLATVWTLADNVAVMYLGQVVEFGPAERIRTRALHPYTQALIAAALPMHPRAAAGAVLGGEVPSPIDPPSGCRFRTRCPHATARCAAEAPRLKPVDADHLAACHLLD